VFEVSWYRFAVGESATTLKVKVKDDEERQDGVEEVRADWKTFAYCGRARNNTGLSAFHGTFAARTSRVRTKSEHIIGRDFEDRGPSIEQI